MNMPTPPTPLPPHIPQALRACFSAQRAAFQDQRNPGLEQRRADLRALHRLLVDNRQALVDAVNRDYGCRSRWAWSASWCRGTFPSPWSCSR